MFSMILLAALNTDAAANPCGRPNCPAARDIRRAVSPNQRPARVQNSGGERLSFEERYFRIHGTYPPGSQPEAEPYQLPERTPEVEAEMVEVITQTVDPSDFPLGTEVPQHAITDDNALARDPNDDYATTGAVIPVGTTVDVLQTDGNYVQVREVLPDGASGPVRVWWTAESNLGNAKEFDSTMFPERPIPLDGLTGLTRDMAVIYNTRGRFIEEEAARLGVDVSTLAGVLQVESQGVGFNDDGTPIIRFENHHFARYWGNDSDANRRLFDQHFSYSSSRTWERHRFREDPNSSWQSFHGDQYKEYQVLEFARNLSDEAGLLSISMGAGQVLGSNHDMLGYDTAREMFDDMNTGIRPQLEGMIAYIENCGTCMSGLRADNAVTFASGYNGSGNADEYGGRIASAATAYDRVLRLVPPAENN